MSSFGNGPTGGYAAGAVGAAEPQRTTPLGRLENALNRLARVTDDSVNIAQALTGGWPQQANDKLDKALSGAGMFGAIEEIATAIHRNCDRLDEASAAVSQRLP